MYCSDFIPFV